MDFLLLGSSNITYRSCGIQRVVARQKNVVFLYFASFVDGAFVFLPSVYAVSHLDCFGGGHTASNCRFTLGLACKVG